MRLIDANALKEKAFGKRGGLIHTADIDEMPTIEERKDCTTCRYNDYEWYNEPCDSCTGRHYHWRPVRKSGKWIKVENVGRFNDTLWECSECKCCHSDNIFAINGDFNFCPNCGADMRGEEE